MINQKFGRLIVIERSETRYQQALWRCVCECGTETFVTGNRLRSGQTKSCGCLRREVSSIPKDGPHRQRDRVITAATPMVGRTIWLPVCGRTRQTKNHERLLAMQV